MGGGGGRGGRLRLSRVALRRRRGVGRLGRLRALAWLRRLRGRGLGGRRGGCQIRNTRAFAGRIVNAVAFQRAAFSSHRAKREINESQVTGRCCRANQFIRCGAVPLFFFRVSQPLHACTKNSFGFPARVAQCAPLNSVNSSLTPRCAPSAAYTEGAQSEGAKEKKRSERNDQSSALAFTELVHMQLRVADPCSSRLRA